MNVAIGAILAVVLLTVAIVIVVMVLTPLIRLIGRMIKHVYTFIASELGDVLRIAGAVITGIVLVPLVLVNVVIGRWSASSHYGRAVQNEASTIGHAIYRIFFGHPARLLGLTALTDGLEKRIPEAMAKAPTSDRPSRRTGQFDGYRIIGSIKGGGSGARLYVAEPDERKRAALSRMGHDDVDQVVIKVFSMRDGSSLSQIMRENRALEAARKLGLVLEHEQSEHRFFYVMRFVPGEDLNLMTQKMHSASGPEGLTPERLREALGYAGDLASTLKVFHEGGLWHKDVKPDNIIVHDGVAHVVDLGLVTQLTSGMTLTTHGTEYFRDPEMVRLALKGVKVSEVDGAKFDIYAAGAVLYSMIENSFPAHGALSKVTKRCPETVRWIIRRAMTDYNQRYETAGAMLADLSAVLHAEDPYALKPKDLPSMSGGVDEALADLADDEPEETPWATGAGGAAGAGVGMAEAPVGAAAHTPVPPREEAWRGGVASEARSRAGTGSVRRPRTRPSLRVVNWWTGEHVLDDLTPEEFAPRSVPIPARHAPAGGGPGRGAGAAAGGVAARPSAREQLERARARVRSRQQQARRRMKAHARYDNRPNAGVVMAFFLFLAVCVAGAFAVINKGLEESKKAERRRAQVESSQVEVWENSDAARRIFERYVAPFIEGANEARDENDSGDASANAVADNGLESLGSRLARVGELIRRFEQRGRERGYEGAWSAGMDSSEGALAGREVLVLERIGASAPAEARERSDRIIEALRAAGAEIAGLGDDPEEVELAASVRNVIGIGTMQDPDTRRRIERWLDSDLGAGLAGVVWIDLADNGRDLDVHVINGGDAALDRAMSEAER